MTMEVDDQYVPLIHDDASVLLRPKTGLQDMTLELDPGTTGDVEEGSTIPLAHAPSRTSTPTRSSRPSTPTRATT